MLFCRCPSAAMKAVYLLEPFQDHPRVIPRCFYCYYFLFQLYLILFMMFLFLIVLDLLCILDCIIKSSFLSYFLIIEFKIIQICSVFLTLFYFLNAYLNSRKIQYHIVYIYIVYTHIVCTLVLPDQFGVEKACLHKYVLLLFCTRSRRYKQGTCELCLYLIKQNAY